MNEDGMMDANLAVQPTLSVNMNVHTVRKVLTFLCAFTNFQIPVMDSETSTVRYLWLHQNIGRNPQPRSSDKLISMGKKT